MATMKYNAAVDHTRGAPLRLSFKKGVLSDIACHNTVPSVVALNEMAAADVAAGWPAETVDKARVRRQSGTRLWLSPGCVHLGTVEPPLKAIFGPSYQWLERLWGTTHVVDFVRRWGAAASGTYQGYLDYYGASEFKRIASGSEFRKCFTDTDARQELVESVVGYPVNATSSGWFALPSSTTRAQVLTSLRALKQVGQTLTAVRFTVGENIAAPSVVGGGCVLVWTLSPQEGASTGLEMSFWDGPVTGSVSNGLQDVLYYVAGNPANLNNFNFQNVMIDAEQNLSSLIQLLAGNVGIGDISPSWAWGDETGTGNATAGSVPKAIRETVVLEPETKPATYVVGLTPLAGWGGPASLGVFVYTTYALGNPEFAQGVTVRGDAVWREDVNGQPVYLVDDTSKMLTWSSEIIKLMDAKAVSLGVADGHTDKVPLNVAVIVRSALLEREVTIPEDPLSKTGIYEKATEAEYDIRSEVCIAAEGDNPAVTLGEASTRASKKSDMMFHQLYRSSSAIGAYSSYRVSITGTSASGYVATCLDEKGVLVADADEVALAISMGAVVSNGSDKSTLQEAISAAVGLGSSDLVSSAAAFKRINTEFDESSLLYADVFDIRNLSEADRCAYAVMAYARPRAQLNSIVGSFITMGRLATRKMMAGAALRAL